MKLTHALCLLLVGVLQDEYSAMRDQYMRTGEGFMLVFDVTSRESFDELAKFAEQISRVKDADAVRVPLLVVGNKCDLEQQRQVTTAEAQAFARSLGASLIETSAAQRVNVDEAFHELVRTVRRHQASPTSSPSSSASSKNANANKSGAARRPTPTPNKKPSLGQRLARLFGRRRARA